MPGRYEVSFRSKGKGKDFKLEVSTDGESHIFAGEEAITVGKKLCELFDTMLTRDSMLNATIRPTLDLWQSKYLAEIKLAEIKYDIAEAQEVQS